jgi:hypothetical protein
MLKLTAKHYKNVIARQRQSWPRYATQLMNLAAQNVQAFRPAHLGELVKAFQDMRGSGIPGTLQNWEQYYNTHYGVERLVVAGRKIHTMLQKMGIQWITEDMCVDYTKEAVYNKTHMGCAGQEMAVEVVASYYKLPIRWPTPQEDSAMGIDAWIGGVPVQVKPHDSVFKSHVHNHANKETQLVVTYEIKKQVCWIHNPGMMPET